MSSYTPLARAIALVMSLAVLHPKGLLAQVNVVSSGSGGVTTAGTNVWTGDNRFTDSLFFLRDDVDATKLAQFQASGITTGTTRTYTFQDITGTIAQMNGTAAWSTNQQFNAGVFLGVDGTEVSFRSGAADYGLGFWTQHTPDNLYLSLGPTSNSFWIGEQGDRATDAGNGPCGTVSCTNPHVNFRSAATTNTIYGSLSAAGFYGRQDRALTESVATTVAQVNVAAATGTGGTVDFTVFASDATDHQTLSGTIYWNAVNKAGVETCSTPTVAGTALNSVSAGTLTCTYACDVTPVNAVNLQFNCLSSLVQTTLNINYRVNVLGPGQVTPQ